MSTVPPFTSAPDLMADSVKVERLQSAAAERTRTDAAFRPTRAVVLTVVTLGVYGFVNLYRLLARSNGHLRRRLAFLDAATVVAWERAEARGLAGDLQPEFERTTLALDALRAMKADFRDPAIWLTLAIAGLVTTGVGGLAAFIAAFVFLDADVVKHQRAERAVTRELHTIWNRLGVALPDTDPPVKPPQRYVVRVVASVVTLGLYLLWWMHDLMADANRHVESEWPWEDALVGALTTT